MVPNVVEEVRTMVCCVLALAVMSAAGRVLATLRGGRRPDAGGFAPAATRPGPARAGRSGEQRRRHLAAS